MSRSDELSKERRLDWCSTALGGRADRGGDEAEWFRLEGALLSRLRCDSLLVARLVVRLLSRLLRSLGGRRLLVPGMLASLRLSCWASSNMRWSTSSRSSRRRSLGSTLSPGLYLLRSACFSSSVFPLSGLALMKMSSSVVTVALGWVVRTEARHEGQV